MPGVDDHVILTGSRLSIAQIAAIARGTARVEVPSAIREAVGRGLIDEVSAAARPRSRPSAVEVVRGPPRRPSDPF
ncbi:hypothetical protein AX769_16125 [Frondihabitans sp. PAMC 28766]|nr:hypothetical protein AX769_16125 [Frondihabitans sp. PAMC 28766]